MDERDLEALEAILTRAADAGLLDTRLHERHHSPAHPRSDAARGRWAQPDLRPLPAAA